MTEHEADEIVDRLRLGGGAGVFDGALDAAAVAQRRDALCAALASRGAVAQALVRVRAAQLLRGLAEPEVLQAGRRRFVRCSALEPGDLCEVLLVEEGGAQRVLKIARSAANDDLLEREMQALARLWGATPHQDVVVFGRYLPQPLAALVLDDGRHANLLSLAQPGSVSLTAVQRAYPRGVDAHALAWMASRLFEVLAWVHRQGVVHGAVLPGHVLIHPATHGMVLVDWCYAVLDWRAQAGGPHLEAVIRASRRWYPPEVFRREPATPALDLYLAARTLVALAGGDALRGELPAHYPREMADLLRGCLHEDPTARFDDAFVMVERWCEMRLRVDGPLRFRPFHMPGD